MINCLELVAIVREEKTREDRPSTGDGPDASAAARTTGTDASAAGRAVESATVADPDVLEDLRSFENNTISRTGRVIETIVVDYEAETTPRDVEEAVRSALATASGSAETARSRLVDSSEALLERAYPGVQAFVLVELPSGDAFVDRIAVPERDDLETPDARRHDAFVAEFGDLETLSQLEGEHVPIGYSSSEGRWIVETDDGPGSDDGSERSFPFVRRAGVYALLSGLFVYAALSLATVPSAPTIGAVGPRSLLLASMALLLVGFGIDLVRSAVELGERTERSRS